MNRTPLEKLGLLSDATVEEIKARWRGLVMTHHPDHGGNLDMFNELRETYRQALEEANTSCQTCNGVGKIVQHYGFSSVELICPDCGIEN